MKSVACIIVNWNGKDHTLVCLESLKTLNCRNINFSVFIVDNNSTDNSVELIKHNFPKIKVIELPENQGFTGGNNVGIKKALESSNDYIWLLNNDTTVDSECIQYLIAEMEKDTHIGIAGSKIYFSPGHEYHSQRYSKADQGHVVWFAGGIIDWQNVYASHRGVDEVDIGQYDEIQNTSFVTGCSMFIRRSVIEQIGYLNEHYYLYLEDVEYSLRALRYGYELKYIPQSKIWHINAGSSAKPGNLLQQYYQTRNRLLLGLQYAPIRAKIALVREAIRFAFMGTPVQKKAVRDYVFRRFGKQFIWEKP